MGSGNWFHFLNKPIKWKLQSFLIGVSCHWIRYTPKIWALIETANEMNVWWNEQTIKLKSRPFVCIFSSLFKSSTNKCALHLGRPMSCCGFDEPSTTATNDDDDNNVQRYNQWSSQRQKRRKKKNAENKTNHERKCRWNSANILNMHSYGLLMWANKKLKVISIAEFFFCSHCARNNHETMPFNTNVIKFQWKPINKQINSYKFLWNQTERRHVLVFKLHIFHCFYSFSIGLFFRKVCFVLYLDFCFWFIREK